MVSPGGSPAAFLGPPLPSCSFLVMALGSFCFSGATKSRLTLATYLPGRLALRSSLASSLMRAARDRAASMASLAAFITDAVRARL